MTWGSHMEKSSCVLRPYHEWLHWVPDRSREWFDPDHECLKSVSDGVGSWVYPGHDLNIQCWELLAVFQDFHQLPFSVILSCKVVAVIYRIEFQSVWLAIRILWNTLRYPFSRRVAVKSKYAQDDTVMYSSSSVSLFSRNRKSQNQIVIKCINSCKNSLCVNVTS